MKNVKTRVIAAEMQDFLNGLSLMTYLLWKYAFGSYNVEEDKLE